MNNSFIVQEAKSKLGTGYVAALLPYAIIYAVLLHISLLCYFAFPWSLIITIPCLIGLFLFYAPMEYGMLIFYAKSYKIITPTNVEFLNGFKKSSMVKAMFLHMLRFIYVFLLSLLLFVPGIIMSINYSYAMLILHNNNKINITDALEESCKIMKGHRKQYFKLQFRLIPWYILAILTAGIGFIFISPYKNMLNMVFYKRVIKGDTGFMPKIEEEISESKTEKSKPQDEVDEFAAIAAVPSAVKIEKNPNSVPGINKKSKDNNKLLNNKIAHPILEKYDEFDKSPEQIKLEQELSALIDTGEEGESVKTTEPYEISAQSGEGTDSSGLENLNLEDSDTFDIDMDIDNAGQADILSSLDTKVFDDNIADSNIFDVDVDIIVDRNENIYKAGDTDNIDSEEEAAILQAQTPIISINNDTGDKLQDTDKAQRVTVPQQNIIPAQPIQEVTEANTVSQDGTAEVKTGRARLEELLAKRQAMQKKD